MKSELFIKDPKKSKGRRKNSIKDPTTLLPKPPFTAHTVYFSLFPTQSLFPSNLFFPFIIIVSLHKKRHLPTYLPLLVAYFFVFVAPFVFAPVYLCPPLLYLYRFGAVQSMLPLPSIHTQYSSTFLFSCLRSPEA